MITNHGTWSRYVPEKPHPHAPANTMYCRRDGDGVDWYEFQKTLDPDTVKCTVRDCVVQAVYRDASFLFPQECMLIEIDDRETEKPYKKYRQLYYDADTNTLCESHNDN